MWEKISAALGLNIVGKAYDDVLHPGLAELGKLFSLPLKAANHYGDRLLGMMTKAKEAVPLERQLPAAPSIAGPIFENVKYLEEGNPLLAMYQKLLTQLIDRDGVENAHPAFPKIIEQLSSDEAWLLFCMSGGQVRRGALVTKSGKPQDPKFLYEPRVTSRLIYPKLMGAYLERLMLLGVTSMYLVSPTPIELAIGLDYVETPEAELANVYDFRLCAFGQLFAKACIPAVWDFPTPQRDDGTG